MFPRQFLLRLTALVSLSLHTVCMSDEQPAKESLGRFDTDGDLFLAHFDSKTDVDDIHSVAAVATMLADPRFSSVRYHAVAGAYGIQEGLYVPANELFELAFGSHWSDAHSDYQAALDEVTDLVSKTLELGGKVWITETCWIFGFEGLADANAFFKEFASSRSIFP